MNPKQKYFTTNDVAELMGRSPAAIRNLVMRRRIPYRKVAGRLVFILSEIEEWIDKSDGITPENLRGGVK